MRLYWQLEVITVIQIIFFETFEKASSTRMWPQKDSGFFIFFLQAGHKYFNLFLFKTCYFITKSNFVLMTKFLVLISNLKTDFKILINSL